MIIDDILFQSAPPRFKGAMWLKPSDNSLELKAWYNGDWKNVAGNSDEETITVSLDRDSTYLEKLALESLLGHTITTTEKGVPLEVFEEVEMKILGHTASSIEDRNLVDRAISMSLASLPLTIEGHGKVVNRIGTIMKCEDGTYFMPKFQGLREVKKEDRYACMISVGGDSAQVESVFDTWKRSEVPLWQVHSRTNVLNLDSRKYLYLVESVGPLDTPLSGETTYSKWATVVDGNIQVIPIIGSFEDSSSGGGMIEPKPGGGGEVIGPTDPHMDPHVT